MAIVFSIWRAQELAHAAPRERRSLWPCTARCTARVSAETSSTARESAETSSTARCSARAQAARWLSEYHLYWRHLVNCIAMRVAIVSATTNGSSMCQYKHTRLWLECIWFLYSFLAGFAIYFLCRFAASSLRSLTVFERSFGCFCHLSLCRFAASSQAHNCPARG